MTTYRVGIDIGSTTVKLVLLNERKELVFGKYMRHTCADEYLSDWANLIIYGEEQKTVWDYEEYPQFMIATDNGTMVPLTAENAGEPAIPFEETLFRYKVLKKLGIK